MAAWLRPGRGGFKPLKMGWRRRDNRQVCSSHALFQKFCRIRGKASAPKDIPAPAAIVAGVMALSSPSRTSPISASRALSMVGFYPYRRLCKITKDAILHSRRLLRRMTPCRHANGRADGGKRGRAEAWPIPRSRLMRPPAFPRLRWCRFAVAARGDNRRPSARGWSLRQAVNTYLIGMGDARQGEVMPMRLKRP